MNRNLEKRRREMIKLRFSGASDWAERIAKKYGVSKSAIHEDWRRRGSWIEDLSGGVLENAIEVCKEMLFEIKKCREEAWKFYHNAANDNAKVGALRLVEKSARNHIKLLNDLGSLDKDFEETSKDDLITVNIEGVEESPEDVAEDEDH